MVGGEWRADAVDYTLSKQSSLRSLVSRRFVQGKPQLRSERNHQGAVWEQSAGKPSDSLGVTSSLERHLHLKCVSEAAEYSRRQLP